MLLLENLLDGLLGVLTLGGLVEGLLGNGSLQAVVVEAVTGGHDVRVVNTLDERLNLGSACNLLLSVLACDLLRVALNANDKSVAVGMGLSSLVKGLDDDDLLSGLTTSGDDGDLVGLQELSHCWIMRTFGSEKSRLVYGDLPC